jgi:hypothetical protein
LHERITKFEELLEKNLKEELDKINQAGTISPTDIKTVEDAVCLMLKIKEYDEWEDGQGYSNGEGNYSYRRGRNSMNGRYMSRDPYLNGYSGRPHGRMTYAYDRGYSGHSIKDRMVDKLESMYDEAQTEHERQMIDEWISRIESK